MKISARSKWNALDRAGTAGPDRGGSQAAQVAARCPAHMPNTEINMSTLVHSHMRASVPEIFRNMRTIVPKGSPFSFLFSYLDS